MKEPLSTARRRFLRAAGLGAPLLLAAPEGEAKPRPARRESDVSPTEDLMREHGILRRLLLVYREAIRRIEGDRGLAPEPVAQSARIIRAFIEDYHERDEEELIFPRFVKAGKLTDLVGVLRAQHEAGRKLTAEVQRLSTAIAMANRDNRRALAQAMRQFVVMYEPHAAREDTVLFPAFAALIGDRELRDLQETFERKENALPLGNFEAMVAQVARIEDALGIGDLARFTPVAGR